MRALRCFALQPAPPGALGQPGSARDKPRPWDRGVTESRGRHSRLKLERAEKWFFDILITILLYRAYLLLPFLSEDLPFRVRVNHSIAMANIFMIGVRG